MHLIIDDLFNNSKCFSLFLKDFKIFLKGRVQNQLNQPSHPGAPVFLFLKGRCIYAIRAPVKINNHRVAWVSQC